jgi:hypothetical protein
MGHADPALGHHGHQVSVAQPVGDVPADAQFDDLSLEPPASIDPIACFRLAHLASCRATNFQQAPLMHQNRIFQYKDDRQSNADHGCDAPRHQWSLPLVEKSDVLRATHRLARMGRYSGISRAIGGRHLIATDFGHRSD